jgi:aryl sulfotransferase
MLIGRERERQSKRPPSRRRSGYVPGNAGEVGESMSSSAGTPIVEYRSIVSDNRRWSDFVSRPGDIFVCTPPKCGTTWTQAIVVSLLFPDGNAPGPVTEIAPWLDARFEPIDVVLARLDAQEHRRSIKTHTPADGIPWFPDASYIVVGRDGRDAFMSFLNHMQNMQPELVMHLATTAIEEGIEVGGGAPPVHDVHAFFDYWIGEEIYFRHLSSFWAHRGEPNLYFVHYDDLKADLSGSMRGIADFLGIEVDDALWPAVVDRCTFASMKARSGEIGEFRTFVGGADTFLYKGTNDRWRGVLTDDELARFEAASARLLPPDAVAWLNRGTAR